MSGELEALRAALRFYADPKNWAVVEVPADLIPDQEHPQVEVDGEFVDMPMFQSGPAIDGGEHARFVLSLDLSDL